MQLVPHKKFGQYWPTHESLHKIHLGRACQPVSNHFTAFVLLLKTGQYNRTIQKSELKTKKQDRTIKNSEFKTNRHNRPIQKSELKTKKQDRTIKESELKTNRYNRPIQKSELCINRLYRPIQSEDQIGIGKSINRTFRPPLPYTIKRPILKSSLMRQIALLEYINTLLKRSIPKKPRKPIYDLSWVMSNFLVNLKLLFLSVLKIFQIGFLFW
jgi:hypothetical protein